MSYKNGKFKTTAIVGLQWGDEGKGKITDYLSKTADYVVRYQGGANAGHTIYINNKKIVLHQIPTGILNEKTICVIGNGCVLNIEELKEEIEYLKQLGISVDNRLFISPYTHVVTAAHLAEDGDNKIKFGSTGKGIGPAYRDRTYRCGTRFMDTTELQHLMTDTSKIIYDAILNKKTVIFEGAQGALLDLDYGTYPYVTSCHTLASYAAPGTGIPAKMVQEVVGVVKAYTTRVGTGPFPTELDNELGACIREIGKEYGATTGRPRRIGWLDLPALKYACRINGVTKIALTKLDTLSNFDSVLVALGYKINGEWTTEYPTDLSKIEEVKYVSFTGWGPLPDNIKNKKDLPLELKLYVDWLEMELDVTIKYLGIGPGRNQLLIN